MTEHDRTLETAFDRQAAAFEKAAAPSDPEALARLVAFAALPAGSLVLDPGCGPGLVAAALLGAGHRVLGVDLSAEMVARARARCAAFVERARFRQQSVFDPLEGGFDAAVSRYVVHHVTDPAAFLRRQVELLRPGGVLVVSDITSDPDPERARWHDEIERLRDRSHTRLSGYGELIDLFAAAGLAGIAAAEDAFELDFDEWFDRGTPAAGKEEVRARMLSGPGARGFRPRREGQAVKFAYCRALVRGVKPG